MQPDIFGNLNRENEVLAKLQDFAAENRLDEYQVGMARILRFKQNHRLLDATLEFARRIERASDILIAEVLNVLVAQDLPVSIRASAAAALGYLISRRPAEAASDFDLDIVIDSMAHVLGRTESRILKKALFQAIGLARTRNGHR